MVLLLDIVYGGTLSLTYVQVYGPPFRCFAVCGHDLPPSGSTDDIYFSIRPRFAASQEYKVQQMLMPNNVSDLAYTIQDRHGIRIIVRQIGSIGRFDFQALLLSLTSSLALLALAKTVVECLAFQVLPLRFIYKQYRTIDVRLCLLTP
jgi:ATP P2X receptor